MIFLGGIAINNKNINNYYIRHIQSKIKKLENKKQNLKSQIESEEKLITKNKSLLSKIKLDNSLLVDQYNTLVHLLKLRGSVFQFKNVNLYNIKPWDNLYLIKSDKDRIIVKTKNDENVYAFDKEISNILNEIIVDEDSYSIVVMRVNQDIIKAQLRIN